MKNKILIATGIFPPDIGGPATMLAHLARSLTERGFGVKVLTYTQKQESKKARKQKSIYKIYYVNINSVFAKINYFFKMFRLAGWANVIYVTDTYSVGRFAYYIKRLLDKPYILRFTGDSAWETARANGWTEDYIMDFNSGCHPDDERSEEEGSRGIEKKIKRLKKRRNKILLNADKVIVDCQFNKRLAEKIVGTEHCSVRKDKINIIYNAIDFKNDRINEDIVQQIKNKYSGKIIVTACRLTPWKGIDKIIHILPELIKKLAPPSGVEPDRNKEILFGSRQEPGANTRVNFLILGQGSESEKLKINNKVHFLGKINQNEIINYFAAADVFVLNSQYEGLSHTLLEVMKSGTPIVTTNCGGNPELITDGQEGLLVDYGNNQELLNALVKILTNRGLADKLAGNAKNKVKEFEWKGVVEGTVEVIKKVRK